MSPTACLWLRSGSSKPQRWAWSAPDSPARKCSLRIGWSCSGPAVRPLAHSCRNLLMHYCCRCCSCGLCLGQQIVLPDKVYHRQQQPSAHSVVGHCNRQGNMENNVGEPQGYLGHQRCGNQQHRAAQFATGASAPDQGQQNSEIPQNHQSTNSVGYVYGYPAMGCELPTQIVWTHMLSNIEAMLEVHILWPPLTLTGGQIGTGNGGVVGGCPGAQCNLQDNQQQTAIKPGPEFREPGCCFGGFPKPFCFCAGSLRLCCRELS